MYSAFALANSIIYFANNHNYQINKEQLQTLMFLVYTLYRLNNCKKLIDDNFVIVNNKPLLFSIRDKFNITDNNPITVPITVSSPSDSILIPTIPESENINITIKTVFITFIKN